MHSGTTFVPPLFLNLERFIGHPFLNLRGKRQPRFLLAVNRSIHGLEAGKLQRVQQSNYDSC